MITNKIKVRRKDIEIFLGVLKYNTIYQDLEKLIKTVVTITDENHRTVSGLIASYTVPKDKLDADADDALITIEFSSKLTRTFIKIENYIKIN